MMEGLPEFAHAVATMQEELVQALRSDGRRQAAQRMLRQKRDGQMSGSPLRESEEDDLLAELAAVHD